MRARHIALLSAACALAISATASAELAVEELVTLLGAGARGQRPGAAPPVWLTLPGTTRVPLLVQLPRGVDARARGLVPAAPGFAVAYPDLGRVSELGAHNRDLKFLWSPPRRALIEQAGVWARVDRFKSRTGGTGLGAVIGIIDTGLDVLHRDFRHADGTTRVRWLIDFSQDARAVHAELESDYGCLAAPPAQPQHRCAIFSSEDLDALIGNDVQGDEPQDASGHGTHVASLAAGNGLSQAPPRHAGIAPEAPLIIARVARSGGEGIADPDIVLAARFIFEQAAHLGLPAVVNLSLGSDFGAHDGSAPVEQALAALVGDAEPGRALIVAAGNSGGLYTKLSKGYPEPLGIHTEVHVPRDSPTRVPVLMPASSKDTLQGTVWIWVTTRASDDLSVGLVDRTDEWLIEPVAPGGMAGTQRGDVSFTVLNRAARDGVDPGTTGTVVILDGKIKPGSVFALRFEGHGTARIWLTSSGELTPGEDGVGPLLPRASKAGTINIPASHESLIAVGATLNRLEWELEGGDRMRIESHGSLENPPLDSLAYFSSAGPTAHGFMKPDIVAPGAYIIGAMAQVADPRSNGGAGLFACVEPGVAAGAQCKVTDPFHAVASGTSMASPIVAGAVALLLERDPTLTQAQVRTLLQAGARKVTGAVLYEQQLGAGALDLDESLAVRMAEQSPIRRDPDAGQSFIALADDVMRPDPEWPLNGLLELRDADGHIADGFDAERLRVRVAPNGVRSSLARLAPGSWSLRLFGKAGTGGQTLSIDVELDGRSIVRRRLPIAVDRWVAEGGASARGGCSVTSSPNTGVPLLALLGSLLMLRRRLRRIATS
ncbi:MAG TPA: S8 family serine peptidase [Polyangiaceae bacterium]|nr:S8 family serine peptidase [Polyangiaceae bacterium]